MFTCIVYIYKTIRIHSEGVTPLIHARRRPLRGEAQFPEDADKSFLAILRYCGIPAIGIPLRCDAAGKVHPPEDADKSFLAILRYCGLAEIGIPCNAMLRGRSTPGRCWQEFPGNPAILRYCCGRLSPGICFGEVCICIYRLGGGVPPASYRKTAVFPGRG